MIPIPKIEGGYRCIVADPATDFAAGKKGRPQHYDRMTDHEIGALPVRDVAADDCWLFLWVTSPKLYRPLRSKSTSTPQEIAAAWGFRFSGRAFILLKTHKRFARGGQPFLLPTDSFHRGMGYTTRKNAEDVLLFRRGKPERTSKSVEEIIIAPLRENSRKPDEFYQRVERYCDGPRLELFARQKRDGWACWGDEAGKFDESP